MSLNEGLSPARAALRGSRTAYRWADEAEGPQPEAINAALLCRDELVGNLSERSAMLARGILLRSDELLGKVDTHEDSLDFRPVSD